MPEKYLIRVAAARYACVPLANLGDDPTIATVDALLGRLLSHNRQVLWASEAGIPDLGGSESDDHHAQGSDVSNAKNVPVVVPGAYRSVCIEIEVQVCEPSTYGGLFAPALSRLCFLNCFCGLPAFIFLLFTPVQSHLFYLF